MTAKLIEDVAPAIGSRAAETVGPIARRSSVASSVQDRYKIERCNLVSICKLVIKSLIDSSLAKGCAVDNENDNVSLGHFFIILENILYHGSKGKRYLIKEGRDVWQLIEYLGGMSRSNLDIVTSIKAMTNIRTNLGRLRAWLRLAMMQKSLAEYFNLLIDHKALLFSEYYEQGALMLEEEAGVISGLLVGLNFLDCIVVFKDDDLDLPLGIVNYSCYLKEVFLPNVPELQSEINENKNYLAILIDQKLYLEELNKNQNSVIANLNKKVEALMAKNFLLQEELDTLKGDLVCLQREVVELRNDSFKLSENHKQQFMSAQLDIQTERETYLQSSRGLNLLCEETEKILNDQVQMRLDVEKELLFQINLKQELEVGMRLLEKDVHEKQDFIMSLRKQLEDIKSLNIGLSEKMQEFQSAMDHKTDILSKLELKNSQMASTIRDMEIELRSCRNSKKEIIDRMKNIETQLMKKEAESEVITTDLKMEKEWRTSLQSVIDQEKSRFFKLSLELISFKDLKTDYGKLLVRSNQLQSLCEEQERALAELGSHLSESKLKVENMMEAQINLYDAQWTDDKSVAECRLCKKPFSVSRRKHHCRSCGEIFCHECSSTKMPLPSCPKPVRVCDSCSTKLLKRFCL